jgi:hypothetical protein
MKRLFIVFVIICFPCLAFAQLPMNIGLQGKCQYDVKFFKTTVFGETIYRYCRCDQWEYKSGIESTYTCEEWGTLAEAKRSAAKDKVRQQEKDWKEVK